MLHSYVSKAGKLSSGHRTGKGQFSFQSQRMSMSQNVQTTIQFTSVPFSCSVVSDPLRPHELQHARPPCLSPTLESTQTHLHCVSDAIQPSHPLSSPSPVFNLSQDQGLLKWVSSLHQVAKVLGFSFNISPSNEQPGLISFRMDWLDLLAAQGTLKSLLQHHSSKASIL